MGGIKYEFGVYLFNVLVPSTQLCKGPLIFSKAEDLLL